MSEDEFAALDTQAKWSHISKTMDYIVSMDRHVSLRDRYQTNKPKDQLKEEKRSMRVDQYQRWSHVKALYACNRDELTNTLDNPAYQECKSILERIFTVELDDALREVIEE